jgi:K+-transporting ATPase ATPase A chain
LQVDLIRAMLWVLLPISLMGSVFWVWQDVPMTFLPFAQVTTVVGTKQTIAQGPAAALAFIEELGSNGGGFLNANAAHP